MTAGVTLEPLSQDDGEHVVALLSSQPWPFHAAGTPSADDVRARWTDGRWRSVGTRAWWVVAADGHRAGLITVDDLDDVPEGAPLLDVRLREAARGSGLGTAAVRLVVTTLYESIPDLLRIEATTRRDNVAMRRVLERCGFVKEAHYRHAWPDAAGVTHDGIGYALLRHDWATGTTTPVDWAG